MRPAMRICLAVIALVALGTLGGSLAVAFRGTRAAAPRPARPPAASPEAPGRRDSPRPGPAAVSPATADYSFGTFNDPADKSFNELLGINNLGHIAGYLGSGAAGHPSQGYILRPPYGKADYQAIMFPGSAQTRLTGLNDEGVQVGFWSAKGGTGSTGCYLQDGRFHPVAFPAAGNASPPVNRLLGVNDRDVAVGFYTDASGLDHGYRYDIATKRFSAVTVPGASSVVAAAINDSGSVAGFFTGPGGVTEGFVLAPGGQLSVLSFPHAAMTRANGINDSGEVVGDYGTGTGGSTHGFTWTQARGFAAVDGPVGAVDTVISGVNNAGELVGYYTGRAGNTDGLTATPRGSG